MKRTRRKSRVGGRALAGVLAGTVCALGAGALGGCAKPLLAPTQERTPFDRYDAVRSRYAPQYTEDAYGRRQPNLRGRLEPKN